MFGNIDAGFRPLVSDNQFKEIIAQRDDLTVIDGGRMVPPSAETVYYAGTVLIQFISGANAGLYAPYDSANSSATDGSAKPVGFLYGGADVYPDGGASEIRVVTQGTVFRDLCVYFASGVQTSGLPDAVVTAMGATAKMVHGQRLVTI